LTLVSCATASNSKRAQSDQKILAEFLDSTDTPAPKLIVSEREFSESIIAPQPEGLIAPGDSISIAVWGYPEFTTHSIVKASGTIVVPLIGEIMVSGLSKDELTRTLRDTLARLIQGEIRLTLEVIPPAPQIIIIGAVSRPGRFPLQKSSSLLDVLSIAGGWTPTADLQEVQIVRRSPGSNPIRVNLILSLEKNQLGSIPLVDPGDAVIVPERQDFFAESATFFVSVFGTLVLLGILSGFQ